jgi:hypothetical protein
MRRFHLQRDEDTSGVSGTGVVAEGIQFTDGHCALRWLSDTASTVLYDSVGDLIAVHGHEGRTQVVWTDELPTAGARPALQLEFTPTDNREFVQLLGGRGEVIARLGKAHP